MAKRKAGTITIRDVAKRAGVSPITASRALRGASSVRPETRDMIRHVADEMGYIPNFAAGMLSSHVSQMIAVIVPNLANSIFATTLQEIGEGVREAGYQLLVACNDYSLAREEDLVRTFLSRGADAIVLTGHLHTPETRKILSKAGIPVIEMWSVSDTPIGVSIGIDDRAAALCATRHLIAAGKSRIGYIGGTTSGNDRAQARIGGFRAALAEAGLPQRPDLEIFGPFEFDTGASAIIALRTIAPDLDAVFAASDIIATGALLQCLQDGVRVPEDVAICGFDDARIVQMIRPALTTISFSRREIGKRVAEVLLAQLLGQTPEIRTHRIAHRLIIRQTG